ncbi:PH domain-containing protein [Capnocytophaga canimorsus]|uniref:Uncharacterized protein YyaB-like PH domain-containing protein n=2 Tax=Capnocytophaga canimorsus TaxID=28188 RepID=A0A250G549_9FLAO|nr:PH domain-containing protein [Capnocytophaga canimorsus]ATA77803.1 hypothetical protein CGC47_09560 [Capnocytophaga canimorsus]ATA92464.1 hypothetical protein CGC56_10020 [Capnocytophaga canimorsus]PJI79695.1 PH (Pleckstrin Homology) domain-containing protein [Capnocytophaga canimorsus]STA73094.1 Protein of uncharacterised function (DUF1200) [Capnocytophaga canimorsus]GJQ03653.1 hypothetical protein CAPN009_00680 [Capnocytophaga canimorsus]
MKSYKAKISCKPYLVTQLPIIIIALSFIVITQGFNWYLVLTIIIFYTILLWMTLRFHEKTNYSISGQDLLVSFTFVISFCEIINIQTIRKISKCNNIMPLGTMDRVTAPDSKALEIFYNKYETIKVSPKNESEFIKDLLEINPNIEVVF